MVCPKGWLKALLTVLWEEFVDYICFWRKRKDGK